MLLSGRTMNNIEMDVLPLYQTQVRSDLSFEHFSSPLTYFSIVQPVDDPGSAFGSEVEHVLSTAANCWWVAYHRGTPPGALFA